MPERKVDARLVPVAIIGGTFAFMTGYEWLKQWMFPGISIWRSHAVTIFLVTVLAAVAFVLVNRIQRSKRKELVKSESRFKAMYEGTSEAVMLLDEKGFFDCNPKTLEMFGFKMKEDFCRIHPADISPPKQPDGKASFPAAQERIRTAFLQGSNRFEWIHRRVNSEDFPAEVFLSSLIIDGRKVLQATVRDITLRRKAEEALAESEKTFKRMFEITSEGIGLIDPVNSRFIAANPALCNLFGYTEKEFITLSPEDLTPPEAKEILRKAMKALFNGGNVGDHEGVSLKKDGTRINVIVSNRQLLLKSKPVFQTTFKDVTFLKDMQKQLEKKNQDIIEFTAATTHDLKKPLSTIKTLSMMIGDIINKGRMDLAGDFTRLGSEATAYMETLIDDLLTTVQLEFSGVKIESKDIHVSGIVEEVLRRLTYQVREKNIAVTVDVNHRAHADGKYIEKTFMNLIGNAAAYMDNTAAPFIKIHSAQKGEMIEFTVQDNGRGIPEKDLPTIFNKFKRGTNVEGIAGTGLGLPIVKSAVEAHGGRIWVESAEGKGTTFYFTLPAGTGIAKG
jgi:PAS domain S-box-containing protein